MWRVNFYKNTELEKQRKIYWRKGNFFTGENSSFVNIDWHMFHFHFHHNKDLDWKRFPNFSAFFWAKKNFFFAPTKFCWEWRHLTKHVSCSECFFPWYCIMFIFIKVMRRSELIYNWRGKFLQNSCSPLRHGSSNFLLYLPCLFSANQKKNWALI